LDNGQDVADSIIVLAQYLQKAGQQGNESAADCARIVSEFGDVVARLKSQTTKGQASTFMELGVGSVGGNTNNIEALETQEEQSATYVELFSWFTESLT
jgi:membrane-bound lytic murein transglycosylase B